MNKPIIDVLTEVVGYGYELAISDITIFEIINQISMEKEKEAFGIFNGIPKFPVTKAVCIGAGRLGSFYADKKIDLKIAPADKIIGSTSILHNCPIATFNGCDYPRPFFEQIETREIRYTRKGWPVVNYLYFMVPQIDRVLDHHAIRKGPKVRAKKKM